MRTALIICLALATLSGCHWEKAISKYDESGASKVKHTVWTTSDTERKLNIEPQKQVEVGSKPDLNSINLFSLPRNYFGTVVYVDEENDLLVNLLFDSKQERGDTLVGKGYFSRLDKRVFHDLEVLIPMSSFNEYQRDNVRIGDSTITVLNQTTIDFIHYQLPAGLDDPSPQDTSDLSSLDTARLEQIYIDAETLGHRNSSDSTLVFRDIALYENSNEVLMLSGQIHLPSGASVSFHSLSDPLPLIPMAIGAIACFGVKRYREYKKRLAEEQRLQALARSRY